MTFLYIWQAENGLNLLEKLPLPYSRQFASSISSVVGAGKQICSGVTCGLTCQNLILSQAQYPIQTYL